MAARTLDITQAMFAGWWGNEEEEERGAANNVQYSHGRVFKIPYSTHTGVYLK